MRRILSLAVVLPTLAGTCASADSAEPIPTQPHDVLAGR
jgi:hypothetical protein